MAYENCFASVYDVFTDGVDYSSRAEYLHRILLENSVKDGTVLDVACGTGSISKCFLDIGYEVVANDISVAMLNIAREKLSSYGEKVVLLCQDMCELDLFGTVDAAVCCLDSINHLLDCDDIYAALNSIGTFLRKDGILIFDVNSVYKHQNVLSDRTFVYEDEHNFLVWQNSECNENIIEMYIDIFSENEDGTYDRTSDIIIERAYSTEFLKDALSENGFELLNVYGDMKFSQPEDTEERIYFVAKKK